MADDKHVIESIDETGCAGLLEAHHFGRIAVQIDGGPVIFPVNYLYVDGRVAIRTDPGTKLSGADFAKVAFEIDAVDDAAGTGWSVLVRGIGYDITNSMDAVSEELRQFPVDTWAPGVKSSWIRIEPDSVTGRRINPA